MSIKLALVPGQTSLGTGSSAANVGTISPSPTKSKGVSPCDSGRLSILRNPAMGIAVMSVTMWHVSSRSIWSWRG